MRRSKEQEETKGRRQEQKEMRDLREDFFKTVAVLLLSICDSRERASE